MKKAFIIIVLQLLSVIVFSSIPVFDSFFGCIIFIGFICGVSTVFYSAINIINLRHVILILAPIYLSYAFYWFPLLNQPSNAEYRLWELVFVVPGALTGLLISIVVYLINIRFQRKK